MSYEALYRKYRPSRFGDVVGQQHITSTLKNQVIAGRIAHAYLFCGTRGTGKTTTARIFARAINCLAPIEGEPCDRCEGCLATAGGVDVIEIDGGSNSKVEQVRDLLEMVRFSPVASKYKVYIIDEVHTLSSTAFTALLKTLEEPPAHVVFLLATTEPGKLPATIHSRCQRFDFHRVSTPDLVARLKFIAEDIGASYDEEGLRAIALAGQGSVRDMLSIADECLAFCENDLVGEKVRAVLGSVSKQALFGFVDALLAGNAKAVLGFFDRIVVEGVDLMAFVRDLSGHFRDLMVAITCGSDTSLIDCTDEDLKHYARQAQHCPIEKALRAIDLLSETESTMKWLSRPRIAVEATLVRICRPQDEPHSLDTLLERVSALESKIAATKRVGETAAEAGLPPFSIDEEPQPQPAKKPAKRSVPEQVIPKKKAEAPNSPPGETGDANAMFNALLSAIPGNLQPLVAKWNYRLRGGRLEVVLPNEWQGRRSTFNNALEAALRAQPGLDAVLVNEEAPVPSEQKKPSLRELGEQVFGNLS
ncbi:MAG: DNA polymerase III subunit gamma/tau [Christensenellales bacterium]